MKVAMLLSGGVDSSVALASLMAHGGYEVEAFYLKIWLEDDLAYLGDCPWEEDLSYAKAVCEQFNVPLKIISLQKPYWDLVIAHVISELRLGRTPSPDILCNQRIKYGAFCQHIDDSFEYIASGHYAQVKEVDGKYLLLKGADPVKDQTYFLSHLDQKQLKRCLFPIGHLQKNEVRELASKWNLPNQARRDSQGICFLGKIKYPEFVKHHLGISPGPILRVGTDEVLGKHQGYWFHTIGQRKGLGLSGGPWYVASKDPKTNRVYVEHGEPGDEMGRRAFKVQEINYLLGEPNIPESVQIKIRHGAKTVNSTVHKNTDDELDVLMHEDNGGVAEGQYAVFYNENICLGGGVISGTII